MKAILKYIVLSIVLTQYFVGSVGFTVHHCCCKKLYHTSACVADGFHPYELHDCLKVVEDKLYGEQLSFRPYRHCGNYTYSMDFMKYHFQKNVPAPPLYLVMLNDFTLMRTLPQMFNVNDIVINKYDCYSHTYKRRWCEQDCLCIFTI